MNNLLFNQKVEIKTLLYILKSNKLKCNISDISYILGLEYLFVRDKLIYEEKFPRPIDINGETILSKKWFVYDVLLWWMRRDKESK